MYIDVVPNRNSPSCISLRESYRVGKKVKKRTLANLTSWPPELIENFRVLLKGGVAVKDLAECFEVVRPVTRSEKAKRKVARKRTEEDLPVHSFRTLLKDLATIAISSHKPNTPDIPAFEKVTIPPPVQQRALALLGIRL